MSAEHRDIDLEEREYEEDEAEEDVEQSEPGHEMAYLKDTKVDNIKSESGPKPIKSTAAYKNKDFKLSDGKVEVKKYTQKLPMVVTKNLDLLKQVEKFIRKQAGGDILSLRGEIDDEEFEELVTVQELFDEIMECINAHHNKEPFELLKPVIKINKIRRIMMHYI